MCVLYAQGVPPRFKTTDPLKKMFKFTHTHTLAYLDRGALVLVTAIAPVGSKRCGMRRRRSKSSRCFASCCRSISSKIRRCREKMG